MADYWPGTVAGLLAQAQYETNRTDATVNEYSSVLNGIITEHNHEAFWFNQVSLTPSTVASQEYYTSSDLAALAELHSILGIILTSGSTRIPLVRATQIDLDEMSTASGHTGQPKYYAYYNKRLRLYPIPGAVYVLTILATEDYTALDEATDTNDWLSNKLPFMFMLHKACAHAYKFWFGQYDKAAIREGEADRIMELMRTETRRRESSTTLKATVTR